MTTMTEVENSLSLVALPAELLYRLCDYLDTSTILFLFRNVCVRFYTIANNYKRYKLHFTSMSKADCERICRIIRPENIFSLYLWYINSETINCIQSFLALLNTHKLTHLQSLNIWKAQESDLNTILRHIAATAQLRSLAVCSSLSNISFETLHFLSEAITQTDLRRLVLKSDLSNKDELSWPVRCALEKLDIVGCTSEQLRFIFDHSPYLHTLILHDCKVHSTDESLFPAPFQQLTHLTFSQTTMPIDKLEFLLSLTPSLTHLYLKSFYVDFDFMRRLSQWENFIREKLSRLQKFKFYVTCNSFNFNDIELLMAGFRTPFWLKENRWPVTCESRTLTPGHELTIYSSGKSQAFFLHQYDFNTIFCSTSTINDEVKNKIQWRVVLDVTHILAPPPQQQYNRLIGFFLRNAAELVLEIDTPSMITSPELLLILKNVTYSFDIWLIFQYAHLIDWHEIRLFARRLRTVRSLGICSKDDAITTTICDTFFDYRIPMQQLKMKTTDLNCMKCLLSRMKRISSVQFLSDFPHPTVWTELREWLTKREENFSIQQDQYSLTISFRSRDQEIVSSQTGDAGNGASVTD